MSEKNFMAYGDAETVLTGFATDIKAKQPKTLETPITIEGVQKTTVEGALQGLVGSVADGKALIASAITNKGVQTASNDTFQTMANNINAIPSIPSGNTFYCIMTCGRMPKETGILLPYSLNGKYLTSIKATAKEVSSGIASSEGYIYLGLGKMKQVSTDTDVWASVDGASTYTGSAIDCVRKQASDVHVGTVITANFSKITATRVQAGLYSALTLTWGTNNSNHYIVLEVEATFES